MTKMKITAVMMLLVMVTAPMGLMAFDPKHLVAYPVPFNPKKGVKFVTIELDPSLTPESYEKMVVEVFDVNGDAVRKIEKTGVGTVQWNGRNSKGSLVKPGLYIFKVTIENETTGEYGQKIIRVLVAY